MKTFTIAIVGAGYMAQEHARAFASLPNVRIVGIHSRTHARAEALAAQYGATVFSSVSEMYETTRADAVVVAVPELAMQSTCDQCFAYPWVCLLEKPAGLHLTQAEEILASSQIRSARCHVALNRRSYASTRQAIAELGHCGGPRLISVLDQQDMEAARTYGQPELVVRNWMYANSIHLVDYFRLFGRGEVIDVQHMAPWTPEKPGHVASAILFSSGDIGVYTAVWNGPGPWSVTVTNQQVRLEMRPLERLGIQRRGERQLTNVTPDPVDTDFKPGLRWQAEQLTIALASGSCALATLAEATRSMALVADIYGLRDRA